MSLLLRYASSSVQATPLKGCTASIHSRWVALTPGSIRSPLDRKSDAFLNTGNCVRFCSDPLSSQATLYEADHSRPCNPDGVTHRYARMCAAIGIDSHLHQLRHYSATELISAGVDIRTVAGRLGHGGGGTTTLRVYAAWVPESDKRAAALLAGRMPRPARPDDW